MDVGDSLPVNGLQSTHNVLGINSTAMPVAVLTLGRVPTWSTDIATENCGLPATHLLKIIGKEILLVNYQYQLLCKVIINSFKKLDMLRDHKPPPIRSIRISDFGLPDLKHDPDRHQNCITWSLTHALPLQKISSKSVHKFASNPTDRQTNRPN